MNITHQPHKGSFLQIKTVCEKQFFIEGNFPYVTGKGYSFERSLFSKNTWIIREKRNIHSPGTKIISSERIKNIQTTQMLKIKKANDIDDILQSQIKKSVVSLMPAKFACGLILLILGAWNLILLNARYLKQCPFFVDFSSKSEKYTLKKRLLAFE